MTRSSLSLEASLLPARSRLLLLESYRLWSALEIKEKHGDSLLLNTLKDI